jgi:hypothetical protein
MYIFVYCISPLVREFSYIFAYLYMYYICGLWPLWNTTSLFLTWYQSLFSRDRRRQFAPASLSPVPDLAAVPSSASSSLVAAPDSSLAPIPIGRPSPGLVRSQSAAPVPASCGVRSPGPEVRCPFHCAPRTGSRPSRSDRSPRPGDRCPAARIAPCLATGDACNPNSRGAAEIDWSVRPPLIATPAQNAPCPDCSLPLLCCPLCVDSLE